MRLYKDYHVSHALQIAFCGYMNTCKYVSEWIVLPPAPKKMDCIYNDIFQFEIGEYMYFIGDSGNYGHDVFQRFSTLNKSWEIVMDDMLLAVRTAILLSTGQVLIGGTQVRAGPNTTTTSCRYRNGYEATVVALFKPATNELLDVSVDAEVSLKLSFFFEHEDNCYIFTRIPDIGDQIKRVIWNNFDSDEPSMLIADVVEDKTMDPFSDVHPEFTFDTRKLGLVYEYCNCELHCWARI